MILLRQMGSDIDNRIVYGRTSEDLDARRVRRPRPHPIFGYRTPPRGT